MSTSSTLPSLASIATLARFQVTRISLSAFNIELRKGKGRTIHHRFTLRNQRRWPVCSFVHKALQIAMLAQTPLARFYTHRDLLQTYTRCDETPRPADAGAKKEQRDGISNQRYRQGGRIRGVGRDEGGRRGSEM